MNICKSCIEELVSVCDHDPACHCDTCNEIRVLEEATQHVLANNRPHKERTRGIVFSHGGMYHGDILELREVYKDLDNALALLAAKAESPNLG